MSNKKLKIKLLPTGEIEMHTEGIKGKKCLDYIELMEVLADAKVVRQEFTRILQKRKQKPSKTAEQNSLMTTNMTCKLRHLSRLCFPRQFSQYKSVKNALRIRKNKGYRLKLLLNNYR